MAIEKSLREAGSIGAREAHNYSHQSAILVNALLTRIFKTIEAIKKRALSNQNTAKPNENKLAAIVNVADKLSGQQPTRTVVNTAETLSEKGANREQVDLKQEASSAEVAQMAQNWREARNTLVEESQNMSVEDKQALLKEMSSISDELGTANLAAEVMQQDYTEIAKTISKVPEKTEENERSKPREEAKTAASRDVEQKRDVVEVSDSLSGQQVQATPEPSTLAYNGEDYNIYHNSNETIITDKENNVMFAYTRDGDQVTVTQDKITNNPAHFKDFEKANAAISKHGIDKIQAEPTRRAEAATLGGLAREGSRAIAVASMVTNHETPVTRSGDYVYRQSGSTLSVDHKNQDLPPGEQVAVMSTPTGISTNNYSANDRKFFKKTYESVSEKYSEAQTAKASAASARESGKPVLKQDREVER